MGDRKEIVGRIHRQNGVAGQVAYTATVRYVDLPDVEDTTVSVVGHTYGEPGVVVLDLGGGHQTFVQDPERYGEKFDQEWAKNFFLG